MAPLAEFGQTEINPIALAQQLALMEFAYDHNDPAVEALLAGNGRLIHFHKENNTWPPDWLVVQSVGERYFVSIAGTVGPAQIAAQSPFYNITQLEGGKGVITGMLWGHATDVVETALRDYIPLDNPETRVFLSGHSYGGIVAQLLAFRYARAIGGERVQLITVGQPKGLSGGYTGPQPSVFWRVSSTLDVVPSVVLDIPGWLILDLRDPWQMVGFTNTWEHYGRSLVFDPNGDINTGVTTVNNWPDYVQLGPTAEHRLDNYIGRGWEYSKKHGNLRVAEEAFRAALASRQGSVRPPFRDGFSLYDFGVADDKLAGFIERIGFFIPRSSGGGGPVSIKQLSLIFAGPDSEQWTESYAVENSSDVDSFAASISPTFLDLRCAFLHRSYKLRAIRVSEVRPPKATRILLVQKSGTATGAEGNPGPDIAGSAAVHYLQASNGARRHIWFRGYADQALDRQINGGDAGAGTLGDKAKAWITALATAGYGINRQRKDGEAANTDVRLAYRVDGSVRPGQALVYMTDTTGYLAKDRVRLSMFNKKDLPGINGEFVVKEVSPGVGIYIHYATADFRNVEKAPGRVRRLVDVGVAPFVVDKCYMKHLGPRKTKRSFTGSRGGSRAARIRHLD